ncbi:hypothetical protein L6452_10544 [Arctium lappa]|uniref:Uncharacterized protein n=1 Tax=Arctium lappa TaxID=4217 RepID=A0ACB9DNQ8_ARCLA|nr:hypothetical protein L6452_10544 [Arctium lappa]
MNAHLVLLSTTSTPATENGPGLFSDIGRKAKDLLTRDYLSNQRFSVSTTSVTGVEIMQGHSIIKWLKRRHFDSKGDANRPWNKLQMHFKGSRKEMAGEIRGRSHQTEDIWWCDGVSF